MARNLQQQATTAENNAATTAGGLGATAGQVGGALIPGLERQAANPPGMTPMDLANQQSQALEAAGGTASSLKGGLMDKAMRSRNPAGLNATTAAVAQGASRAAGQANQDILSQNAMLKNKQQEQAQTGLEGIYGTDTKGMLDAMGLIPQDINANVDAQKVGWVQNLTGLLGDIPGASAGPLKYA